MQSKTNPGRFNKVTSLEPENDSAAVAIWTYFGASRFESWRGRIVIKSLLGCYKYLKVNRGFMYRLRQDHFLPNPAQN